MNSVTITLPIYYTEYFKTKKDKTFLVGLNWYRNAHFMLNNKVKHHYHEIIEEKVRGLKFNRIVTSYKVYVARNGTDGHNIRSIIEKYALDALVDCGVIEDDSTPTYVVKDLGSEYFIDKESPRFEMTITEYYA